MASTLGASDWALIWPILTPRPVPESERRPSRDSAPVWFRRAEVALVWFCWAEGARPAVSCSAGTSCISRRQRSRSAAPPLVAVTFGLLPLITGIRARTSCPASIRQQRRPPRRPSHLSCKSSGDSRGTRGPCDAP